MTKPARPLFVARRTYRLRRIMDAARILPVLGLLLLLAPVFWYSADPARRATASGGIYLFVVWFGLVLFALAIARVLAPALDQGDTDAEES